jgi:Putative transposase
MPMEQARCSLWLASSLQRAKQRGWRELGLINAKEPRCTEKGITHFRGSFGASGRQPGTRARYAHDCGANGGLAKEDLDHPHSTRPRKRLITWCRASRVRTGRLSLQSLPSQAMPSTPELGVNAHDFSLHAAVRWRADQRKKLEQLCRYITRPASDNKRL